MLLGLVILFFASQRVNEALFERLADHILRGNGNGTTEVDYGSIKL